MRTIFKSFRRSLLDVSPKVNEEHLAFPASTAENPKQNWVTYPDMHGNALLIIYRLISDGVLQNKEFEEIVDIATPRSTVGGDGISDAESERTAGGNQEVSESLRSPELKKMQYQKLQQLYYEHSEKINALKAAKNENEKQNAIANLKKNIKDFKKILSELDIANNRFAIRFIGDLLADRGAQDYFTLLVFDHMRKKDIKYEVLFSNHDASFMSAYENGFLKTPQKDKYYLGNNSLGQPQATSQAGLSILLSNNIVDESEIKRLTEKNHKPDLKLISYDVYGEEPNEDIIFYTHAPVDFEAIEDMAIFLGIEYKDETIEAFCNTLDQINSQFSLKLALGEINEAIASERNILRNLDRKIKRAPHDNGNKITDITPLTTFSWSRVKVVYDNNEKPKKEPRSEYTWPTSGWKARAINCHGHSNCQGTIQTVTILSKTPTCINEIRDTSKHFENTDTSSLGKAQETEGEMIQGYSQNKRTSKKILLSDTDKTKTITRLEKMADEKKPLSQYGFDFLWENSFRDFSDGIFNGVTLNQKQFEFLCNKGLKNFAGADLNSIDFRSITDEFTLNGITLDQNQFDPLFIRGFKNFSGAILKGVTLNQAQLDVLFSQGFKNFSGVNLSEVDLSDKDLLDCDFTDTIVSEKTFFKNTKLSQIQFDSLHKGSHKNFSGVDLSELNLSGKDLTGCDFQNASLRGTNFNGANLTEAKLTDAAINYITNFSKCIFKNVKCEAIRTPHSHEGEIHLHNTTASDFIAQYEYQYRQLKSENTVSLFRSNYIESNYYKSIKTNDEKLLAILSHTRDKPEWTSSKVNRTGIAVLNTFALRKEAPKNQTNKV